MLKNSTVNRSRNGTSTNLSPNQTAALAALAEGFTVREIAVEWGNSKTVVYRNIEAARKKLDARTTEHAVAIWACGKILDGETL